VVVCIRSAELLSSSLIRDFMRDALHLRKILGVKTARATTCPISAYVMAYNMLRYVFGAVRALG